MVITSSLAGTLYSHVTSLLFPNPTHTHFSFSSVAQAAFKHCMECDPVRKMFTDRFDPKCYNIDAIDGMNEIYVSSSNHHQNSDTVFYMEHCDGPYSVYPFCHVYRCMLAVNENKQVETIFPMEPSGKAVVQVEHIMLTLG